MEKNAKSKQLESAEEKEALGEAGRGACWQRTVPREKHSDNTTEHAPADEDIYQRRQQQGA